MNSQDAQPSGTEGNSQARTGQSLPRVGEPVWVRCDGYRTMAFLDDKGKWRNLVTREELTGVVQVIERD
jgi:hypothetical protein